LACVNPPANSEGKRTKAKEGDLFIVITGAGVTNPAQLDRDLGEAYVSQHVALIKPTTTTLSRWLLLCLMSGPRGRDELLERAYGAGKPGLNLDNIRSLSIPLPPLAEQPRIVAKVDELTALCDQLDAQLTKHPKRQPPSARSRAARCAGPGVGGGRLSNSVLGLVTEWGEMHQSELLNWTTLAKAGIFRRIAPLVSDNRE
jgi:hypothetical protein